MRSISFFLQSFVRTFVGSRVVSLVSSFLRSFIRSLFSSCLYWFVLFVHGCSFGAFVVRCASMSFDCNHSASPPGGNQVDGLPPALHFRTLTLICVIINDVF